MIGLPALSVWLAVVIIADLTAIGDQPGFLPMSNAARPAMCGLGIEVPDSASYRLPLSATGDTAAITSTPGAVMSGLSRSPPPARAGPLDENAAMAGASTLTCVEDDRLAVAPAPADVM